MSRAGRRPLLLLLAALMLAIAGCGSEPEDGPRTLSKREYIAQANGLQEDANAIFAELNGRLAATPAAAQVQLAAFDELIAGYEALDPPRDWRDEHAAKITALQTMRHATLMVSRASARNRPLIEAQVARSQAAQDDFGAAVRSINASR